MVESTVFVYRNKTDGKIVALYLKDAIEKKLENNNHYLVASIEPRLFIQHHYDNVTRRSNEPARPEI